MDQKGTPLETVSYKKKSFDLSMMCIKPVFPLGL